MIKLYLKRTYKSNEYTIGKLYINNEYFCDTLEDCDRGLTNDMTVEEIKDKKIFGITAIPSGTYQVQITYSPKFKMNLPILLNVKGFTRIRIHSGNKANPDSLGCILVGKNTIKGQVTQSKITLCNLLNKLNKDKDISITIE